LTIPAGSADFVVGSAVLSTRLHCTELSQTIKLITGANRRNFMQQNFGSKTQNVNRFFEQQLSIQSLLALWAPVG
jgi:hypothetical protein